MNRLFKKTSLKKHILLYDAIEFGHHKNFIVFYTKTLVSLNCSVSIVFPNSEQLFHEFDATEIEHIRLINYQKSKNVNSLRFKVWQNWQELKANFRNVHQKVDFMFIMWFDDFKFHSDHPILLKFFLRYFNWTFKCPWIGINVHQVHFRKKTNNHEIWCKELITNHSYCRGVGIFDEGILGKYQGVITKSVYLFPDVTKTEKANSLDKSNSKKIVLPGVGDRRKGILRFIKSAELAVNKDWEFIILGKINWNDFTDTEQLEITQTLNSQRVHCTGFIESEALMNEYVDHADLIFAAYEDFPHSSNILTKAAAFNKFVLVNEGFLMAERIRNYQIGLVIQQNIELDLNRVYDNTKNLNPKFNEYLQLHSIGQLNKVLESIVK